MGRLIFLLLLFISTAHALVPENIFQNDIEVIEKIIARHTISKPYFERLPSKDKFNLIKTDPKGLILDDFFISPFFEKKVHFWFNIYTLYPSSSVVLHDTENLDIVYSVVDFSELQSSILNKHTTYALQVKYTEDRIKIYRKALVNLAKNGKSGKVEALILKALKESEVKIPSSKRKRKSFFLNLSKNIRAQTGQRDNIIQGLINMEPYKKVITNYFNLIKAPKELLAIPFLESSFNTKAISKVGAAGVWQFMPFIGKLFMPLDKSQDGRNNPLLSTLGALHLLKQNKQILKRWDLAVTAYNSGTKHIIRARRRFKVKNMGLEYMLKNYDHPHIGFASSNFYSGFLALVYSLSYKKELFGIGKMIKPEFTFGNPIHIYLTKCSLKPSWFYRVLKRSSPELSILNRHLKWKNYSYPRGTILFSDVVLNKNKYYKLSESEIRKLYPRNFTKLVKGQSCSTR